jgi:hypothetical protein
MYTCKLSCLIFSRLSPQGGGGGKSSYDSPATSMTRTCPKAPVSKASGGAPPGFDIGRRLSRCPGKRKIATRVLPSLCEVPKTSHPPNPTFDYALCDARVAGISNPNNTSRVLRFLTQEAQSVGRARSALALTLKKVPEVSTTHNKDVLFWIKRGAIRACV